MNRLAPAASVAVLRCLVDGVSMRATSRITGVSFNAIARLLRAAGPVALREHDARVRNVRAVHLQLDEVWSFVLRNDRKRGAPTEADEDKGSVWTFTALDADTRLLVAWLMGRRDFATARLFARDLRSRVAGHPRISTDGLSSYLAAVEDAFGATADFGQEVYGERILLEGTGVGGWINTSLQERMYFSLRQQNRRFTRKTSGFSKRLEQHVNAFALWALAYNWTKQHSSLGGVTPAMEAGLTPHLFDVDWIAELVEASYEPPGRRGPYRKCIARRSSALSA